MKKTIFFLFCLLTYCSQVIATDCNSCDSCETALNVVGADTVVLTTDITSSGTCINDPANSDNKIFDCQGHSITGITTGFGSVLEYLGNSPHLINNTFYDNNNTIKINASSKTYFEDNTIINGTRKCIEIISTDILFNGTNDFSGCSGSAFSGGNSIVNDNLIISG